MSSSLPLFLNPPIHHKPRGTLFAATFPSFSSSSSSSSSFRSLAFNTLVCFASSGGSSQFGREESLWLREEQRWLREEQRWLREEQRWARERDALLRRVSELELRIQAMDRRSSIDAGAEVSETIASIAGLIEVLKEKSLIAEAGSSATPLVLEEKKKKKEREYEEEKEIEKEVVVERVVRVSGGAPEKSEPKNKKKRSALRKGSEGDEVRALQEALQKLGFYSGEEDMEYSSFSSGTERAVKTWQASLGAREDGIMTEELLERLFVGQFEGAGLITTAEEEEGANGAAITEIANIQETIVKDDGVTGVEVSKHRVFLLGENRWEDPSRLASSNKKAGKSKTDNRQSTTKCITCRGEGRLMCTECDGTGEPNIEPQFMEWVDEGANCPYCEGLGYTICDVCDGKTVVQV